MDKMHKISVSLVYATSAKQWVYDLEVPRGTLAKELIEKSGILKDCPELQDHDTDKLQIGVYSNKVEHDYLLEMSDRVEIYRPLTADPKEVRRQLAKIGKTMGKK